MSSSETRGNISIERPFPKSEIPLFKVFMSPTVDAPLLETVHSGYITQGPRVKEFEAAVGAYLGNERVLALNSGTSALELAVKLLRRGEGEWPGIIPGDEVLSCPLTCTATNWAMLSQGLRLKWVDVDQATAEMDLRDLEAKLSPRTKVILVVHWAGTPVDLDALAQVQDRCKARYGFRPWIVEDCAHAFGATWRGAKLGSGKNLCCFSLQAIKHLTCGDGGLLTLPNDALFERGKRLRWYGIDRENRGGARDARMEPDIVEWGHKWHMNDVAASIGLANLPHIPAMLEKCRANAAHFDAELAGLFGVSAVERAEGGVSSFWLYTLRVSAKYKFMEYMKSHNIMVSQVHKRNDGHSCVAEFKSPLPNLDQLEQTLVCIPCGWWLDVEQRNHIVNSIRSFSTNLLRPKTIVTGGCGFIGHHVVEHLCKHTDNEIIVIDKLSYASKGFDRLRDTGMLDRVTVYSYDLCNRISEGLRYEMDDERIEVIIHMAAETHVDNSIRAPTPFIRNNIESTLNMLEFARSLPNLRAFFYFSTDEVFGSAPGQTSYSEWDRHQPSNPYSASKSAAENICLAYYNTFKVPVIIMNVMNAFGQRQHPEKFVPLVIRKALAGELVTIHTHTPEGSSEQVPGSRFYIHARNIAAAVLFLLNKGTVGEKYNVVGEREVDNLEMAKFIADVVGKPLNYALSDDIRSRPGHDIRYALNGTKMAEMGWTLPVSFEDSLREMVQWTVAHPEWLTIDRHTDSRAEEKAAKLQTARL